MLKWLNQKVRVIFSTLERVFNKLYSILHGFFSMSHEKQFRALIDSAKSSIVPAICSNLVELYSHYGIPTGSSLLTTHVTRFLRTRICERLKTNRKELGWNDFRKLSNQLIGRHIISGIELMPYIAVAEIIREEARNLQPGQSFLSFDHVVEWQSAITDAMDLIILSPYLGQYTTTDLDRKFPRMSRSAQEVAWLKNQGFMSISVVNGNYFISPDELSAVTDSIEQDIRKIGGLNLALRIFSAISNKFDQKQCRYHLCRITNPTAKGIIPQIPIGYLLNLCVKPDNFAGGSNSNEDTGNLLRKSIALGGLKDVQPYSLFENLFNTSETILNCLRKIAIYDSLFTIPQLRPADICVMLRSLFNWVDNVKAQRILGWTVDQVIEVVDSILQLSPPQKTIFFTEQYLAEKIPKISRPTIKVILDMLTHSEPSPNKDFKSPKDIEYLNFQFKPLLYNRQNYCLIDASWCGASFYEAIVTALRKPFGEQIDGNNIGKAAEEFLKIELRKRNIIYISGKYHQSGKNGECDLIIETADTIILVEHKKKPLTRKARGGEHINLLIDIYKSLINSQVQLGNHELLIQKDGFLNLEDSTGKEYHLELKGRKIERISLTLLDYGGFHSRDIMSQFLTIAIDTRFNINDSKHAKKFKKLNEKLDEFRAQTIELNNLGVLHKRFFNCWFISVPQFLVLLDDVKSNDDFKRELWRTRHLTTGSLDFYSELAFSRNLGQ